MFFAYEYDLNMKNKIIYKLFIYLNPLFCFIILPETYVYCLDLKCYFATILILKMLYKLIWIKLKKKKKWYTTTTTTKLLIWYKVNIF